MVLIKKLVLSLFSVVFLLIAVYVITIKFYPSFGGDLTSNQIEEFKEYENFKNDRFI